MPFQTVIFIFTFFAHFRLIFRWTIFYQKISSITGLRKVEFIFWHSITEINWKYYKLYPLRTPSSGILERKRVEPRLSYFNLYTEKLVTSNFALCCIMILLERCNYIQWQSLSNAFDDNCIKLYLNCEFLRNNFTSSTCDLKIICTFPKLKHLL